MELRKYLLCLEFILLLKGKSHISAYISDLFKKKENLLHFFKKPNKTEGQFKIRWNLKLFIQLTQRCEHKSKYIHLCVK